MFTVDAVHTFTFIHHNMCWGRVKCCYSPTEFLIMRLKLFVYFLVPRLHSCAFTIYHLPFTHRTSLHLVKMLFQVCNVHYTIYILCTICNVSFKYKRPVHRIYRHLSNRDLKCFHYQICFCLLCKHPMAFSPIYKLQHSQTLGGIFWV